MQWLVPAWLESARVPCGQLAGPTGGLTCLTSRTASAFHILSPRSRGRAPETSSVGGVSPPLETGNAQEADHYPPRAANFENIDVFVSAYVATQFPSGQRNALCDDQASPVPAARSCHVFTWLQVHIRNNVMQLDQHSMRTMPTSDRLQRLLVRTTCGRHAFDVIEPNMHHLGHFVSHHQAPLSCAMSRGSSRPTVALKPPRARQKQIKNAFDLVIGVPCS